MGIGFLGAGVIVREGASIKGLTTAAGVLVMGAVGLAIGVGLYKVALIGTLFCLLTIVIFGKVERKIKK
jgi:putative Mg2+ transporter-C (MgtC) family protein